MPGPSIRRPRHCLFLRRKNKLAEKVIQEGLAFVELDPAWRWRHKKEVQPLGYVYFLVGDTGLEPVTSSVSGKRSAKPVPHTR